jgi:glycosyltransferase involved in cell wall biosynthesis
MTRPRVVAAALSPVTDAASGHTRLSPLLHALRAHCDVLGQITPALPGAEEAAIRLRYAHRDREAWRSRAAVNPWTFRRRTRLASHAAREWAGRCDAILLFQTLFAVHGPAPVVVYTDNTVAATVRHMPDWLPLRPSALRRQAELESATCRAAARVLTMSDFARRSMIEDYGCDPDRVVTVGSGSNVAPADLDGRSWDRPVALFVGLDFERKGGPLLLEAFGAVRAALPDAELRIAGPPRPLARTGPGVRWLGRLPTSTAVAGAFAEASVLVLPSRFDPYPAVIREAMLRGLACVATDVGGVGEMVADGETGRLVAPGDAGALAAALVEVLGDPATAERMGRAGQRAAEREHTWEVVAARVAREIAAASSA